MVRITLFIPQSQKPELFEVEHYRIKDGVLSFLVEEPARQKATEIETTVPFIVRKVEDAKKSLEKWSKL
jgi:hypothetical protein